jgi:capsular polysaccharide biosynthesis protein
VVISQDNRLLLDLAVRFGPPWDSHEICRGSSLSQPCRVDRRVAVLASRAGDNYFHWMFDVLPRLRILGNAQVDVYYVQTEKTFQKESLEACGIALDRCLPVKEEEHLQAETLVVPSLPGVSGQVTAQTVEWLRHIFLPQNAPKQPKPGKRLYISRDDSAIRRMENEEEVMALLEGRGFQKCLLAGRTIREQVRLFAEAEMIVGMHGSGLSNLVFCAAGTKVLEIFSPVYVNPCYADLAALCQLSYTFILGQGPEQVPGTALGKVETGTHLELDKLAQALDQLELQ